MDKTLGTIKKGEQKDISQICLIWEACFTSDQEYLQLVFSSLFPHCTPYIYWEGERILSTLLLVPILLKSKENPPLKGKYLYGVATLPEARGKKLSAKMVETASNQMQQAGENFIITRPAQDSLFPFYREQGFTVNVPRGTFTQPAAFHTAMQEYFQLINSSSPEKEIEKKEEKAAEKLHKITDSLFNYLAQTYPERFEWPAEILRHMIRIGEFSLFPVQQKTSPSPNPAQTKSYTPSPQPPFALLKALSPLPDERFENAFFNFPME